MKSIRKAAVLILLTAAIQAADPFYLGTWKITSATIAPWWTERQPPDSGESKLLLGKTVILGAKAI